jgi:peptidoglycan-associated lipoprotein
VNELVMSAGDRVFFAFNQSNLTSDASASLSRQAVWFKKYPSLKMLIAGNADERGTEAYNLALGNKRATAAADYLLANGIAPARIRTISYGKDCPIATGSDAAAYQQNRNAIMSVQGYNPQNCH